MVIERPDLRGVPDEVVAYIEALEGALADALADARTGAGRSATAEREPAAVSEPPTTLNVIAISRAGRAKRTPRHYYGRQRRGGMGVFDIDTPEEDPPALLAVADEEQRLLLFTDLGRVFPFAVSKLPEVEVRGRGMNLAELLPFRPGERIVAALPGDGGAYVALASKRGWVRRVRSSFFGRSLIPGITFHDVNEGGPLVAACWTRGTGELFMATRQGQGIRFLETQVPDRRGRLGMRVDPEDGVVAVTAVDEQRGVFLLGADGKGTIRLMSGFRANKSPGAGGKVAMKTDRLVGAVTVGEDDDLFVISELSKIIRFASEEVPPKEGVVQGVNCMDLRADETAAVVASRVVE